VNNKLKIICNESFDFGDVESFNVVISEISNRCCLFISFYLHVYYVSNAFKIINGMFNTELLVTEICEFCGMFFVTGNCLSQWCNKSLKVFLRWWLPRQYLHNSFFCLSCLQVLIDCLKIWNCFQFYNWNSLGSNRTQT
jgi:hypothetical protein